MQQRVSKNILITFDYELFLGEKSGSVDKCLIQPTELILEILKKNKTKAIFFIDTTYLLRLEEVGKSNSLAEQDFNKIKKQLIEMAGNGHYLFHHIHPHWLDAAYLNEINQWDLSNTERFTFNCLNDIEKAALFKYSNTFLTEIYKCVKSNKTSNGFRAGGLYIEPFEQIKPYFETYNIQFDFSVVPGAVKSDEIRYYDFSQSPTGKYYHFNESVSVESLNGKFVEYPITTIKIKGFTKVLNAIYYRLYKKLSINKSYGDGLPVSKAFRNNNSNSGLKKFLIFQIPLSVDSLNPGLLRLYKQTIKQNIYTHFLSHPKLLTPVGLKLMGKLLESCNQKYSCIYDFKKF